MPAKQSFNKMLVIQIVLKTIVRTKTKSKSKWSRFKLLLVERLNTINRLLVDLVLSLTKKSTHITLRKSVT